MNKNLPLLGVALGLALVLAGCETDNASSRIHEKSAVYASLKQWQKKKVDRGIVALGLTPDMVYMAIGNPSSKEPLGTGEVWIYRHYFPTPGAEHLKSTLNTESRHSNEASVNAGMLGGNAKAGTANRNLGTVAAASEPQGGSMEPADMASYTFWVTFEGGVVTHLKLEENR